MARVPTSELPLLLWLPPETGPDAATSHTSANHYAVKAIMLELLQEQYPGLH